jgi:hypothetical protein
MSLVRFAIKHHSQTGHGAPSGVHAAYILRETQYGPTRAQVDYILCQSQRTRGREDLVHPEAHNLPAWADSAAAFFHAADQYEGRNRRVSTTLEVALPRELLREQQIALMQDFCRSQFGDRLPYAVALHESHTKFGGTNPHFHVIWSTRITDGQERTPADHFRRPPRGAGKDPLFLERGLVAAQRQSWTDLHNVYMERAGLTAFIDPRSLSAREIAREPEPRMSPKVTTQAKYARTIPEPWQAVLDGRTAREASRADEQMLAQAAWIVRKAELGITDVHTLDREAFVAQIAEQTRAYALHPPKQPSVAQLRDTVRELEGEVRDLGRQAGLSHAAVMMATHRERQPQHERGYGRAHQREAEPDHDKRWDTPLIGNRNSMIYHTPDHKNYGDVAPASQERFWTERAAQDAGYRRAANDHYGPGSGQAQEATDRPGRAQQGREGQAWGRQHRERLERPPRREPGPGPHPHQPQAARQTHAGQVIDDEPMTHGLRGPRLDRKRGRDGYEW